MEAFFPDEPGKEPSPVTPVNDPDVEEPPRGKDDDTTEPDWESEGGPPAEHDIGGEG